MSKDLLDRDGVRRIGVVPDMHVPLHDPHAVGAALNYMKDQHFDEVIQLGDFLDVNSISAHNKGKPKLVEGERLAGEFRAGRKVLDELLQATRTVNFSSKFTMLVGNHEYRIERFVEEHPALDGMLDVSAGLGLKKRNVNLVASYPKGEVYRLGHAYFTHGLYTGTHSAKTHVDRFGVNIFHGHVHSLQAFSRVTWAKGKAHIGVSCGCLCLPDLPYLMGAPTAWSHAIVEILMLPNGMFNWMPISIFDGQLISPGGKRYSYRDGVKASRPRRS